jgi:protein TonB
MGFVVRWATAGTMASLLVFGAAAASGQDAAPIRVGGAVRVPKKIQGDSPRYPDEARQAGESGVVILEVTIDGTGSVVDAKPLRGPVHLSRAAGEAIRNWVYEPTLIDGRPVSVLMTVTVVFKAPAPAPQASAPAVNTSPSRTTVPTPALPCISVRVLGPEQKVERLRERAAAGQGEPQRVALVAARESYTVMVSPPPRPASCPGHATDAKPSSVTLRRADTFITGRLFVVPDEAGSEGAIANIKIETARGFFDGRPFRVVISFSSGEPLEVEVVPAEARTIR